MEVLLCRYSFCAASSLTASRTLTSLSSSSSSGSPWHHRRSPQPQPQQAQPQPRNGLLLDRMLTRAWMGQAPSLPRPTSSASAVAAAPAARATLAASVVERSPAAVRPYLKLMRADKPAGTWLLFWPCGWSLAMAAAPGTLPDLRLLALFGAGSLMMRGAGCTINDMWDSDIDHRVDRTRSRPITSGQVNHEDALVFLAAQLGVSLLVLLQLNWCSVLMGASSLGLVVAYPLFKRFTHWPQLMLGLTFNWGALMGWPATHGSLGLEVSLPLYAAGVCWTLVYDTIYAHQDKKDDMAVGVKSTALRFGDQSKLWLGGFTATMIPCLVAAGIACEQTLPYYLSVGLAGGMVGHQVWTLKVDDPHDCGSKFTSNTNVGLILFVGAILGTLYKDQADRKDAGSGGSSNNILLNNSTASSATAAAASAKAAPSAAEHLRQIQAASACDDH